MRPRPAYSSGGFTPTDRDGDESWSARLSHDLRKVATFLHLRPTRNLQGVSLRSIASRTFKAAFADRLFGHAAELGFYFLFALFPTLFCAGSLLGLAARSVHQVSDKLLNYLALVIPTSALGTVLTTFNETTAAATSGKVTFGSIAALWSASVGISAIQDTLNEVYKLEDKRSYIMARIYAIGLTIVITVLVVLGLASMFGGDFAAQLIDHDFAQHPAVAWVGGILVRVIAWIVAACLLSLSFAVLYYWAPDWRHRRWRWFTPGTTIGVVGWLLASLGFRVYIHYFNNYTVTYGSLGAVIILLMWFYISGLMLLLGAEIDTVIDSVVEKPIDGVFLPASEQNNSNVLSE